MKRILFLMFVAFTNTVTFAQFRSKQDVYNYLEGKTFVYLEYFKISFQKGYIILNWEDWPKYKTKIKVLSFSSDEAYLSGSFKINSYMLGAITYPMKIKLNRRKEEFKLTGSPEDGTYKLAPQTDAPRTNSFENNLYKMKHVDMIAAFPDGELAMLRWISHHLRYPSSAEENGESGRGVVSFIVDKDGCITAPIIKKSVSQSLDAEALREIKNMHKWNPAL